MIDEKVVGTWLLDTSTFYWCSSEESQARLHAAAAGARFTTSMSSVFEILAGTKVKNLNDRKRALCAVRDICGVDGLISPDPDTVVAHAFGQTAEALPVALVWHGLETGIQARTVAELESAVDDIQKNLRRSVDLALKKVGR